MLFPWHSLVKAAAINQPRVLGTVSQAPYTTSRLLVLSLQQRGFSVACDAKGPSARHWPISRGGARYPLLSMCQIVGKFPGIGSLSRLLKSRTYQLLATREAGKEIGSHIVTRFPQIPCVLELVCSVLHEAAAPFLLNAVSSSGSVCSSFIGTLQEALYNSSCCYKVNLVSCKWIGDR